MSKVKEHPFYIFTSGIIIGFLFFLWISDLDFNDVVDKFKNTSSNYVKSNEIAEYLEKKELISLKKNSYILKSNFNDYLAKYLNNQQLTLINKEKIVDIDDKLLNLKIKNKSQEVLIKILQDKITTYTQKKEKQTTYTSDIKNIISPKIYFPINSSKIDLESLNNIKKFKELKLDENITIELHACKNYFEKYNPDTAMKRINLVKEALQNANINPRKILINENRIIDPSCEDDKTSKITNEKNQTLVFGVFLSM